MLGFGLGQLAFEFEHSFAGLHVLLLDDSFFVALDLIGQLGLRGSQFRDFLDSFGIKNVIRVEVFDGGLFQEVDGTVIKGEPIQVCTDDFEDLVFEVVALIVELNEVKAFAHGLQCFRKFGIKEGANGVHTGGTLTADGLGDAEDVLDVLIDSDEEGDLDVGAHVVFADQAFRALALDLHALYGDVHLLCLMQDGQDPHPIE